MSIRPTWKEIWMNVAELMAQRSHHPTFKVGAIVTSDDNTQILSVGYNGNEAGGENEAESCEPGMSGLLHAEINCLLKLDYNNPKAKTMFLTLSPCPLCAKAIVNSGIKQVIYKEEYRELKGLEILINAGIKVEKF
jgi:dCMP deaminase